MMTIAIASDHAGYILKETLKAYLQHKGYSVTDFGTDSESPVDYPDVILPAAQSVASGNHALGMVLGGSGNGEAMTANKVRGIRCALCWNRKSARLAKTHNNANMLALGARMMSESTAKAIVDEWLNAEFQGGRHTARVQKLDRLGPASGAGILHKSNNS